MQGSGTLSRRTPRARRRPGALGAIVFAAAVLLGLGVPAASGAAASSGSDSPSTGNGSSAAVVTPLLELFEFGSTVGTPLMCSDAGSVVSILGAQTHTDALTSPLVTELSSLCATLASQGATFLQQAITASQSLTLINPVMNPLIIDLSDGLTALGTQYGPALSPFGPTVAGLGGTVAFFEGS